MFNLQNAISIGVQIASKLAEFEAGQPVSVALPSFSYPLDLAKEGLGTVVVSESGTTLSIVKKPA